MRRPGSILVMRRLAAGVGVLASGLAVTCGGSTAGDAGPIRPVNDAGTTTWCTGATVLSSSSQGDAVCIVRSDGSLWCWGTNGCGSLGVTGAAFEAAPVAIPRDGLGSGVKSVSVGWGTTCVVERSGTAACWGNPLPSDVSTCPEMPTPAPISALPSNIAAIAVGYDHACALSADESAWCWGTNTVGQLGDGIAVDRATAAPVIGLTSGVTAIATGHSDSCAVKTDGSLWCWGANNNGQLGDGTGTTQTTPVAVFGMSSGVVAVSVGNSHTCAVTTDSAVWCWGNNGTGALGDGAAELIRLVPVRVELPVGASAVAAGYLHTCAIATDGSVWCWGDNNAGQLGKATEPCDGALCPNPIPTQVSGLPSEVVSITAAYSWTCALERDGTVWCWGQNSGGQLGDGTLTTRSSPNRVIPCGD
jgi:alpha-tubulin suppressor-like RCC1 family protein